MMFIVCLQVVIVEVNKVMVEVNVQVTGGMIAIEDWICYSKDLYFFYYVKNINLKLLQYCNFSW